MAYKLGTLFLMITLGHHNLVAQHYFGIGWHWHVPMKIENCCNTLLQTEPVPAAAISLTYKKEFTNERNRRWYHEMGLTSAALAFRDIKHDNDTISSIPAPFKHAHRGFPSILYGIGRNMALKNNHEVVLGVEGSLRISYTLGGYFLGSSFALDGADKSARFPLFLRANLGYVVPLKLFGQIPYRLLFYTKISAQNIASGPQYIKDRVTGITNFDGKYSLNNSEVGIQFYLDLDQRFSLLEKNKDDLF